MNNRAGNERGIDMTPSTPLISVVIPYLNQPDSLLLCLGSMDQQKFDMTRVEVIVVDNGSRDLPVEICTSFKNVRLEREQTPGPGPARNKGASVARGDIFAFVDADCVAHRNWLATIEAAFSDDTLLIAGGDMRVAFADAANPTMLEAYESIFSYRQKEFIERQGFSATANLAVRKSIYLAVGPFVGIDIAEDREWGQRAARLGYATRYLPGMIVYHPARRSLSELYVKWDRHISHDFAEREKGPWSGFAWGLRALAIGCSPVFASRRILMSRQLPSWRARSLAALALVMLRQYRARKMLRLLLGRSHPQPDRIWNR